MVADWRIGQGSDRHRLERGESLIIGGVRIDSDRGTVGHSDGDVLVHAIVDALLGAAALGDIGQHFPDDSSEWNNAISLDLLAQTLDKLHENGWIPGNLDATVRLQSVKLSPYRDDIESTVSSILPDSTIFNVKFTTAEELGPVGRDEAADASAVCLLKPYDS